LKSLKSEWEKVNNNPKLEAFADEIKKDLKMEPNRKIVIFSQFSDTVNEIYDYLQKK
jgi:ERCC4-related helicase